MDTMGTALTTSFFPKPRTLLLPGLLLLVSCITFEAKTQRCVSSLCFSVPTSWTIPEIVENDDHVFLYLEPEDVLQADELTIGFQLYKFEIDKDLMSIAKRIAWGMDNSASQFPVNSSEFYLKADDNIVDELITYTVRGSDKEYLKRFKIEKTPKYTLVMISMYETENRSSYELIVESIFNSVYVEKRLRGQEGV